MVAESGCAVKSFCLLKVEVPSRRFGRFNLRHVCFLCFLSVIEILAVLYLQLSVIYGLPQHHVRVCQSRSLRRDLVMKFRRDLAHGSHGSDGIDGTQNLN